MKKTREELIEDVKAFIGDRTDDEAIALLENVSDSMVTEEPGEDWKTKFEENDREWRKKYMERFSAPTEKPEKTDTESEEDEVEDETEEKETIDDLFKKED